MPKPAQEALPEVDIEALFKTLEEWNDQLKPMKDKNNSHVGGPKP